MASSHGGPALARRGLGGGVAVQETVGEGEVVMKVVRTVARGASLVLVLAALAVAAPAAAPAPAHRSAPALPALLAVQQAELLADDGTAHDWFGATVAVSGDTAVVGAPLRTIGGNARQGAVYVFVRAGGVWTQQAELTALDGAAGDAFGTAVAVSGGTVVVGAYEHAGRAGAAYVFVRSGETWTQQAELTGDRVITEEFGRSVAVSGDTVLVGADDYAADTMPFTHGAVYVFVRSAGAWTRQTVLMADDPTLGDAFGYAVALEGDRALIGAIGHPHDDTGYGPGAAYVFTRSGGAWSQEAELAPGDGVRGDGFGGSVALSGGTALVGAAVHAVNGNAVQGAAYVFTRSGAAWRQQAELVASDGAFGDSFGESVALSGDVALVGAYGFAVNGNSTQGTAYLFVRSDDAWTQTEELAADDGAGGDALGRAVALAGSTALVGAPWHSTGGRIEQGAAYVFSIGPTASPDLGAPVCPKRAKHGAAFAVSGSLAPRFPAGSKTVTVTAFRFVKGAWRPLRSYAAVNADAGAASRYSVRVTLKTPGRYRFRASTAATAEWLAATSAWSRTLSVK